jgi:hypothetical protein
MNEEENNPLQEILTSIDQRLKKLESQPRSEPSPSTEKPTNSKPSHRHITDPEQVSFDDCPDGTCEKTFKKMVSDKAISEFKHKIKGMKQPHLCDGPNCEEIYDAKEEEECPTCHTRHG